MTDLEKEKIKALRLQGMSYAKIAATLGISDNTVRSFCRRISLGDVAKNVVTCKQCGRAVKSIPKRKPRKFCSDICRATWWNSHMELVNKKAIYSYACSHCGKVFDAYGNKSRKYCCRSCYIADRFGGERGSCE